MERRLRIYPPERQLRSLLRLHPDPTHPGADRLEVGGGRLSLLAARGRLRRVDSGRGRRWRQHRQQLLLDLTLEAGGYTIEATTYGSGVTGDFSLYIDATAASINCFRNLGTLPTGTTSIDGTWNGDCASTHQSGSYARFYAFTLTRRTQVQIDLRSAADAYLYLLRGAGSGGSIVDEDDDGGSTGNNSYWI